MASKADIIVPGALYQLYAKGLFERDIFSSDELKEVFREKLALTLDKYSYRCYGWSLNKNHYHLIIKSSDFPINLFAHTLNTSFALTYSHFHNINGYVFGGRSAKIVIQEELYLKPLIRWVHLNPVRNGLCTLGELEYYEWSGHSALLNRISDDITDVEAVLKNFSDSTETYRDYMMQSGQASDDYLISCVRNANQGKYNFSKAESWVIGDPAFTSMAFKLDLRGSVRVARHLKEDVSLEKLHRCVAALGNINTEELFFHKRSPSPVTTAREVFAFIACSRFDFTGKDVARYLGVSSSAISSLIQRGAVVCFENTYWEAACDEFLVNNKCIQSALYC